MSRERYLVKSVGDNIEGTRAGLEKFLQLADRCDDAVIVVPSIGGLKDTLLIKLLEKKVPEIAKALVRDRCYKFADGKQIWLCSVATLKNFRRSALYLVLWATADTIADVEALHDWSAVVVVSWQSGDYKAWVQDHVVDVIYDDGAPASTI